MQDKAFVGKGLTYLGLILAISLGLFSSVNAQTASDLWRIVDETTLEFQARQLSPADDAGQVQQSTSNAHTLHSLENALLMTLNEDLMREKLQSADSDYTTINNETYAARLLGSEQHDSEQLGSKKRGPEQNTIEINLPLPDGSLVDIVLARESILPQGLAKKYTEINTFKVLSNDVVYGGKVDISLSGFHGMLQMLDGETVFIDPVNVNESQYAVYKQSEQKTENHRKHSCGLNSALANNRTFNPRNSSGYASSPDHNNATTQSSANNALEFSARSQSARTTGSLKHYTIAIATTGEYSAKFGGSVSATMAAITTSLNRVNQILERDLGIHLKLAENNDLLINTDATSDPFTKTTLLDLVYENQEFIDTVIGSDNYDIGHLFTTKGGGLAAIGSVCSNIHKAKGVSGITSPKGDAFDLSFVAHEIGHQLGATHTFNSVEGSCSTDTRTAKTAFEPGSGSSIMSYAGFCGLDNIQSKTDAMYHIGSIKQIENYTNNGLGSQCGVVKNSSNTPPIVDAGANYVIPAGTPFELKGDAIDNDGDALVYAWEQLDAGDSSKESADKGNNALFRVHAPNSSKLRSFPPLENILNNTSARGETLPKHQRFINMSFVAQDNFNVAQSDEMSLHVVRTGSRFALNHPRTQYTRASTYPVFWNVANTDSSPINCTNVDVLLSTDGGNNFDYLVADNVLNNGETSVTIPSDITVTSQGRFKLKCTNNVFFAISSRNFFITKNDNPVSLRFDNEDQAESNLQDASLVENSNRTNDTNNITAVNNTNSGGGSFPIVLYLLMLLIPQRSLLKRLFHRQ